MTDRREFLIGGASLLAAGGAYALTPRKRVSLLGKSKLEDIVPRAFGVWKELPSDALVVPESENSLAAKLYSQTVGRLYMNDRDEGVMLLIAYGDTQSDQLQLHRPEVCYPAFGFTITSSAEDKVAFPSGAAIPTRNLTAVSTVRTEQISYWTRIGEALPTSGSDQRSAKLSIALKGIIPDGVLVRISNIESDPDKAFELNRRFAREMVTAMAPTGRPALVGTEIARRVG